MGLLYYDFISLFIGMYLSLRPGGSGAPEKTFSNFPFSGGKQCASTLLHIFFLDLFLRGRGDEMCLQFPPTLYCNFLICDNRVEEYIFQRCTVLLMPPTASWCRRDPSFLWKQTSIDFLLKTLKRVVDGSRKCHHCEQRLVFNNGTLFPSKTLVPTSHDRPFLPSMWWPYGSWRKTMLAPCSWDVISREMSCHRRYVPGDGYSDLDSFSDRTFTGSYFSG